MRRLMAIVGVPAVLLLAGCPGAEPATPGADAPPGAGGPRPAAPTPGDPGQSTADGHDAGAGSGATVAGSHPLPMTPAEHERRLAELGAREGAGFFVGTWGLFTHGGTNTTDVVERDDGSVTGIIERGLGAGSGFLFIREGGEFWYVASGGRKTIGTWRSEGDGVALESGGQRLFTVERDPEVPAKIRATSASFTRTSGTLILDDSRVFQPTDVPDSAFFGRWSVTRSGTSGIAAPLGTLSVSDDGSYRFEEVGGTVNQGRWSRHTDPTIDGLLLPAMRGGKDHALYLRWNDVSRFDLYDGFTVAVGTKAR